MRNRCEWGQATSLFLQGYNYTYKKLFDESQYQNLEKYEDIIGDNDANLLLELIKCNKK